MESNNNNTMIALALSAIVLLAWHFFYFAPKLEMERKAAEIVSQREAEKTRTSENSDAGVIPQDEGTSGQSAPEDVSQSGLKSRDEIISSGKRVTFETDTVSGSINLQGARIDDLKLKNYHETIEDDSPLIVLLSPSGSEKAYFAEFGFLKNADAGEMPGPKTPWSASDSTLSANGSVTLNWTNDKNLRFERTISLDENYLFTITDKVINQSGSEIELKPYGRIARFGLPETEGFFVLHEGLIGVIGEEGLQEIDYDDLQDSKAIKMEHADKGWLGITDKYWASTMIPTEGFKSKFAYFDNQQGGMFQSDFVGDPKNLSPGAEVSFEHHLFAGAKVTNIIDDYNEELGLHNFDLMIDWGWFHFFTKPLFKLIHWLNGVFGNFGVAILAATVLIKLLFLPLANMSYASMAKMKKVQPEMANIKERFPDDRQKQQKEMMALYKREKINPAAGCWPMLIQIPVFFALYKVLFVTIEMRHAPFFGWIKDLAAPDPTSVFNLFGLLPFDPPTFLMIGIWPLIMGITMFLQMQMNPAPPDPTQAMIFKWMPIVFTFMLATFPAGLVIYWAWNNTLSIIQQGVIMRRHGAEIALFDNLKGMFKKKIPDEPTDKKKLNKPAKKKKSDKTTAKTKD